jgi:GNAT superfamily N-acetyltransferase
MTTETSAVIVTGVPYLALATTLLQRMRLARPTGGIWEAADVQWWWREQRRTDQDGQLFWLDERGDPLAAAIRTDFGHSVQCDVLVLPDDRDLARTAWRAAIDRAAIGRAASGRGASGRAASGRGGARAEFPLRPDDAAGVTELAAAGFSPAQGPGVIACWLDAARRPTVPPLPAGYRLLSRADAPDRPHPMIARNGPDVAERLSGCSLYRPELDLMVEAPDGVAAGYGLFWADPITRVGLVEPMRTEDEHRHRGIASHILAAGLDRLAAHGCRRLRVSNDLAIYLRAGFQPEPGATAAIYTRSGTTRHGGS